MASSSTDSECILKWKNRKLMEKAREFNNLWASDIRGRNQKVEATQAKHRALEEKLETINKENAELISQQKIYEAKIFLLTQKRNLLENQVRDLKALEVKMKKRISDLEQIEGNLEMRLESQAEQHKENIKKTEEKIHNRFRDKERALQAKADAQRVEMENIEKRVQNIKDENSTLKQELKRAVRRYDKDRETHRKMTAKMEFDYQVDLRTAKMKNKVLTDRVETLSTTTEDKVKENEALRERLKSKTQEWEKKRVEHADMLLQIEALTEKLQREQKRTATLNERVTRMEKEIESMWNKYEIEQKAHLFTKKHSGLVMRKHNDLLDRIKFLDHRIKSQQTSIQKLESHLSAKSTFIRNISLDIETSMSLVNDPKKFIKEIIRIKAKLFADDKDSHLLQTAELVFQAVESQKSRYDRYDSTIHNLRKQIRNKELHMLRHIEKIEKPRSELIKIVNEQRRELAKLKSEMNQVTHTLREVNNYLPQKVQSWVKDRISGAVTTVTPIH